MKNNISHFLCIIFALFISPHLQAQIITTIAGNGTQGYSGDGGPAVVAEITYPIGVAVDNSGNIYFSEYDSNRVRKVNAEGVITTIAGTGIAGYNGDGIEATAAELNSPFGLAVDGAGNLYICDQSSNRVRKVNAAGIITTFAGGHTGFVGEGNNGPATDAALNWPINVKLDNYDNVYITESPSALVRKVDTFGIITIVAGSPTMGGSGPDGGLATATPLDFPYGAAVDNAGNIYIAENNGHRVRKVNTAGIISTVAGTGIAGDNGDGGQATAADIMDVDVVVDGAGNLFISDAADNRIRKINTSGIITTVAGEGSSLGDGGPAVDCEMNYPFDLVLDGSGNMYVADAHNNRVRRIASIATPENVVNITTKPITVYPNPSKGLFIATVPSDVEEQTNIIITNMLGEKVKEFTWETNQPVNILLDEPSGVYFMSAVTAGGTYNKEIIVNR